MGLLTRNRPRPLAGQTVAITGAASGIGRALAIRLSGMGCPVAIADKNEEGLAETETMIQGPVLTKGLDVKDRAAQFVFASEVKDWAPAPIGAVFNNAGVALSTTVAESSPEDEEWLLQINFEGVVNGTHAFLPILLDQGFGAIVNTSSVFGLAGVTCVVIRKDLMKTPPNRVIPTIFDYRTHMAAQSLYHTAPVFPIYVSMLTLRWIKKMGGLEKMAEKNAEKAAVLYSELDRNPVFQGSVVEEDRSVMNVCFRTDRAGLEEEFLKYTERNGVVGIKGFPTVGGFRASIYNAMPLDGVQVLAEMMRMFAGRFG